jgi:hypothetical protein
MITASCPRVKVIALTLHNDGGFVRRLLEVLREANGSHAVSGVRDDLHIRFIL